MLSTYCVSVPSDDIERLDYVEHNGRTGQVIARSFFNENVLDVWFGPRVQDHELIARTELTKVER